MFEKYIHYIIPYIIKYKIKKEMYLNKYKSIRKIVYCIFLFIWQIKIKCKDLKKNRQFQFI